MSSALERRAGLSISLGLMAWYALFFLLTSAGVYFSSYYLINAALDEEWDYSHAVVRRTLTPDGRPLEVTVHEERGTALPSKSMREAIDRHFRHTFLVLVVPLVLIGLLGGAGLTFYATRPVRRAVTTVQDILKTGETSRRVPESRAGGQMEALVRLLNRLLARNEQLIRALRESLDHVAHDLRTPLTRLRATAERAVQGDAGEPALRDALSDCLEESEQLVTMVDTLMDVVEAETGATRLERETVAIEPLVREVVALYDLVADEGGIEVVVEVEAGLEAPVDRGRMRRVLANLLDNAIKYGASGATVRITARREGDAAVLAVVDRGCGIAADDLPRIWDRLYRADRSRSRRGLGLGLSYVRAIVEAHGGRVDVASAPDEGATFTVRLPLG